MRRSEGPSAFTVAFDECLPDVERALEITRNLTALDGSVLSANPGLWQTLRNFCGPPISEEDLWTMVGGPTFREVPPEYAEVTAQAIREVLDPVRFPWVSQGRTPTDREISLATFATAILLAVRKLGTRRRGDSSKLQEAAVAQDLETKAGYQFDASRTPIERLDQMTPGAFSRERLLGGAKCDVPVRLADGRLLAIECKVSNGPKNGWKRLNREVAGKADHWQRKFGEQVITAVVLAGSLDLAALENAQRSGVTIFWQHNLAPLVDFVRTSPSGV